MAYTWLCGCNIWIIISAHILGVISNLDNIYTSGCTGERIRLNCQKGHKISIKRVFFGVKNNQNCFLRGRRFSDDCCHPTHEDCLVSDDDSKYPYLNMLCSGRPGCDIEANNASSGDQCQAKGYGSLTTYMTVIHDCTPDEDVLPVCSNLQKRGKQLYIANENYPHPIKPGDRECKCLIRTGNQVGIYIHALDIIFYRSEVGNNCYQDIEIKDEDGNKKVITCGQTGLNAFRNIYSSDVRSVTFTFNNRAPKAQGFVWVQAKAKQDKDFIEVYCGNAMKRYLGYAVDDAESHTIDSNDPTPPLDPALGKKPENGTAQASASRVSDMMALIIGVSVAVAFVIIIGLIGIIIICLRRFRSKRRPVRQEPPPFPSPILKSKDTTNHTSNTYCHYDYDEDKYCSIKRSPMRLTNLSDVNSSAERKLKEAFSQGVSSFDSSTSVPNGGVGYMNYMDQFGAEQKVPLLEKKKSQDSETSEEDEVIMPKSEYIAYVQAIQPQSAAREITNSTLPPKKRMKNKTVTFSPVAMVTPLPSGSDESVPDDINNEDPKLNFLEMYSKTLPSRSPDKVKKVILIPGTQDDMCLASYQTLDCENVTEEDLWKAFHIKLNDNVPSYKTKAFNNEYQSDDVKLQNSKNALDKEDPDYDENPYDNLPYINVGSLRRNNTPENNHTDLYKEILRRNTLRKGLTMESIPETC